MFGAAAARNGLPGNEENASEEKTPSILRLADPKTALKLRDVDAALEVTGTNTVLKSADALVGVLVVIHGCKALEYNGKIGIITAKKTQEEAEEAPAFSFGAVLAPAATEQVVRGVPAFAFGAATTAPATAAEESAPTPAVAAAEPTFGSRCSSRRVGRRIRRSSGPRGSGAAAPAAAPAVDEKSAFSFGTPPAVAAFSFGADGAAAGGGFTFGSAGSTTAQGPGVSAFAGETGAAATAPPASLPFSFGDAAPAAHRFGGLPAHAQPLGAFSGWLPAAAASPTAGAANPSPFGVGQPACGSNSSERVQLLVEGKKTPQLFKLHNLAKLSTHLGVQAGCDPAFIYALSRSDLLFVRPWVNPESGESMCTKEEGKRRQKAWNGYVNEYILGSGLDGE